MKPFELHHGDCLETLRGMADNSVDSIVTDPPYGLSFMGKKWDYDVPSVDIWAECLRVLKPGGHLLSFAGTRTQHRMAVRIEDAGFEIRDMIAWVYGSGFPKSMDVSKAIDKARDDSADILRVTTFMADAAERAGVSRADVDAHMGTSDMAGWWLSRLKHRCQCPKWDQWLKLKNLLKLSDEMDSEVWILNGRKGQPGESWQTAEVVGVAEGVMSGWNMDGSTKFVDREIKAANSDAARQWQGWGTALKPALEPITVARKPIVGTVAANVLEHGAGALNIDGCRVGERWPANLIHDGSAEVVALFPDSKGSGGSVPNVKVTGYGEGIGTGRGEYLGGERTKVDSGSGSAARFFYAAKASKRDREEGLEGFESTIAKPYAGGISGLSDPRMDGPQQRLPRTNVHPTVKPTDLMAYLCRLVTPPGGVVLDPFMGSGSTGKAAMREGFRFIGCELSEEYLAIARARIEHELTKRQQPATEPSPQSDLFATA